MIKPRKHKKIKFFPQKDGCLHLLAPTVYYLLGLHCMSDRKHTWYVLLVYSAGGTFLVIMKYSVLLKAYIMIPFCIVPEAFLSKMHI